MQIVFTQQPDWRMVQASLSSAPSYAPRAPVVAFARTLPKATSNQRVSGDIELDLGRTQSTMTGRAGGGASSFGHVSGTNR